MFEFKTLTVLCCLMLATTFSYAEEYQPQGDGSKENPYQISNVDDLYWFADFVNYKSSGSYVNLCAKLTQDIVVNELEFDTDGNIITEGKKYRVWLPIGGEYGASKYFKGIFDGNNHTISGLYVNGDSQYIGLFGYTAGQQSNLNELPVIKNIGVINSYFKGNDNVGGICGYSGYRTIVENCYFSGTIIGNQYVGGICGFIYNSYNQTKYCYNIGTVSGNTNVGGIQGNRGDIITNSYFLEGCCANPSDNSCVKSLEAFNSGEVAFLLGDGWGQTLSNDNGFPVLNGAKVYKIDDSTYSNVEIKYDENGIYDNGSFVSYKKPTLQDDVYQIANAGNLYWFAQFVNQGGDNIKANAILTADIVVNQLEFGNDGNIVTEGKNYRQWIPIVGKYEGNIDNCYKGTFNGDNHTISGLYFNDGDASYVGLFGRTSENANIENVGVINSYFNGKNYVAGVCGVNYGKINNCFSASVVNGNQVVGGLCGQNVSGSIEFCYNNGNISGTENVGGLCGQNDNSIEFCYNIGSVRGTNYVGGVFGMNYAIIGNCCNTGNISGIGTNAQYIGSLGGVNNGKGTVKSCFNNGTVDGNYPANVCADGNNGVSHCYCLANQDNGEQKTASQFANGTVAILLQANQDGEIWGQKLVNGKSMPVWVSSEKNCCKVKDGKIEHADLKNGFCATCGGYQQPTQDESGVYQIANAGNLYWFAQFVNQGAENAQANAVLTADIVVNNLEFSDGNIITEGKNYRQWNPIGLYDDNLYSGVFDGNGHTVGGLYFNDVNSTGKIGLFGCTNKNATIKNVGGDNSYFNGKNEVGGICGYSSGTIENCYNACLIKGNANVGGICGYNNSGTIQNCYNTGSVNGNSDVAGICGLAWQGSYKNCYNIGEVSGTEEFGSLIGSATNNLSINNCFYLSGGSSSFGTEKSEMWFSCGEVACLLGDGWGQKIVDGKSIPVLASLEKECCKVVNGKLKHLSCENGFCTSCNCYQKPDFDESLGGYQIANAGELYWFADFVNQGGDNAKANAVLTTDIVVDTLEFENDTLVTMGKNYKQWIPIATFNNPYLGIFDGKNKTISGLYFNGSNKNDVGLFGYIDNAKIQNVGVINSYFNGKDYVGGVCGSNHNGIIQNCYNASMVSGNESVGGVCGTNGYTAVTLNCYNIGSISGFASVGGVCGRSYQMLQSCYNIGDVEGAKNVGGVCGYNDNSTIQNCYNLGIVKQDEQNEQKGGIGGICGKNHNSVIKNCYNVGKVEGSTDFDDLCGTRNNDTITNCYYLSVQDNGEQKTAKQFANGTVAKLLFASDSVWGQNTSIDTLPNLSGKIIFAVNVSASENGTVSDAGGEYEYNSKFAIEATPNAGYHFASWSNGSTEPKDMIIVVSDTALVATFEAHSFSNWDTTSVATCAVTGLRTRICACGEVETDTIAKLAHTVVVDSAKTATCTATGLTEGKHCSVCDSIFVAQQTLPALGHKIVVDSAQNATCTIAGLTEGSHCSVCNTVLVKQDTIPAGHTIVVDSAKTAICTATGLTEGSHCSVCDSILVAQQTVPALGHKVETLAGVSSTCTAEGLTEGSRCSVCNEVIKAQETIPALGHSFTNYIYNNDATTEADGTETAVCDHGCGATDIRTAEGTKLTDIDELETAEVVIYAHHNVIVVENATEDIFIYNADGRCVAIRETACHVSIIMQREGIYIVRTGNTTQRVFVK